MRETLNSIWPAYLSDRPESVRRALYNATLTLMANGTPARAALAQVLKKERKSI